jgi:hypothetical protein
VLVTPAIYTLPTSILISVVHLWHIIVSRVPMSRQVSKQLYRRKNQEHMFSCTCFRPMYIPYSCFKSKFQNNYLDGKIKNPCSRVLVLDLCIPRILVSRVLMSRQVWKQQYWDLPIIVLRMLYCQLVLKWDYGCQNQEYVFSCTYVYPLFLFQEYPCPDKFQNNNTESYVYVY